MNKTIDFQEYSQQIKGLIGEDIKLIYKGMDTIILSPITIECCNISVYPRGTTFIYDYQRERLSFHKEDIQEISMSDDEDGLSFCISFIDKSYLIVCLED